MTILTLFTDLGYQHPEIARAQAGVWKASAQLKWLPVKTDIGRDDLAEAAYAIQAVIDDFPEGTIHLVAVDADLFRFGPVLVMPWKGQFIVSANNGLFSLLNPDISNVYRENEGWSEKAGPYTLRNALLPVALLLADKGTAAFTSMEHWNEKAALLPVISERNIRGTVISVDVWGNAVTNIRRSDLEAQAAGRRFLLRLNRYESVDRFYSFPGEADPGEVACLFTDTGHLQVCVYQGNASRLLGLEKGKTITIEFE